MRILASSRSNFLNCFDLSRQPAAASRARLFFCHRLYGLETIDETRAIIAAGEIEKVPLSSSSFCPSAGAMPAIEHSARHTVRPI